MDNLWIFVIAVLLDYILGDPISWPHPILYIGKMIKKYEAWIRGIGWVPLKVGGFLLTGVSIITVVLVITLLLALAYWIHPIVEQLLSIYLLYTSLAAKCLHIEAKKVYSALMTGDILKARKLLSFLVGRETRELDKNEVIRADIETISENTVDGVLAPMLFIIVGLFLDIPVQMAFIYKTINTLDSMVGYIQEPYTNIGYASAKLDDIANYIPARFGSLVMLVAGMLLGYDGGHGFIILKRDRKNHKSPNCGYPEAVTAGLLKIQLGGINTYFGEKVYKPTLGDAIHTVKPRHIIDTIKIMYGSQIILIIPILVYGVLR